MSRVTPVMPGCHFPDGPDGDAVISRDCLQVLARAASAADRLDRVFGQLRVSIPRALCARTVIGRLCAARSSALAIPVGHVLSVRAEPQMVRSNAGGGVAGMADLQIVRWWRAVGQFQRHTVRDSISPTPSDGAVSVAVTRSRPEPARPRAIHAIPERYRRATHLHIVPRFRWLDVA